ncbi:MAG: hypothetical protein EOO20_05840 [Chryseobacterium sp.]|nr:MAG: hypothetical protein EOO20_05840 [Chryseobacterium sp.]
MTKYASVLTSSNGWNEVIHGLQTKDVIVAIYQIDNAMLVLPSQYQLIIKDIESVMVVFGSPIENNRYRIVIIG